MKFFIKTIFTCPLFEAVKLENLEILQLLLANPKINVNIEITTFQLFRIFTLILVTELLLI